MKISIIMCVKNSMPYLMASVKSFQKQTYKNKELIIVYSNSNDNSKIYLDSIEDKNIRVYKYNARIYESLNFGISKAKGDIVGILHSDDIFFSEIVLKKISLSFNKKKSDIIFGNIIYSKKNDLLHVKRVWNNIKIDSKFSLPPHTSTFIRKNIYKKFKYKTNFKISSDTDFLINLLHKNYNFEYLNEFLTIMRYGGLSTKFSFLIHKTLEDINIFKKYNLTLFDYFKKVFFKTKQIIGVGNYKVSKYHLEINNESKIKYFNINKLKKINGKVVSALNLAFISYNEKYNLRTHNYLFWNDGIFSNFLNNKKKVPGRELIKKIIRKVNKEKIFNKIYFFGNLNFNSKKWLQDNLNRKYVHKKLPYANIKVISSISKKTKFEKKSLIILTIPTPKQEIVANEILKKYPTSLIICAGGALNIISGEERQVPNIMSHFYLEWLWRLKFDTKRRLKRLTETSLIFLKIILLKKINLF